IKNKIQSDMYHTSTSNYHSRSGTAKLTKECRNIHLKAGQKMVIEAGSELTLHAGGSFIRITPAGVTLVGPSIRQNAGGSPGTGAGAAPKLPGKTLDTDTSQAGAALEPGLPAPENICLECWRKALNTNQSMVWGE